MARNTAMARKTEMITVRALTVLKHGIVLYMPVEILCILLAMLWVMMLIVAMPLIMAVPVITKSTDVIDTAGRARHGWRCIAASYASSPSTPRRSLKDLRRHLSPPFHFKRHLVGLCGKVLPEIRGNEWQTGARPERRDEAPQRG